MIVDTMSIEEVGNAIIKAVQTNKKQIASATVPKDKLYRRTILKGGERRYDFKPIRTEADGITFYVCTYSMGKKDYKKFGLMLCLFAHFYYQGTNWYAMLCSDYNTVAFYQQHFFERYIERHLKDGSKVSIDTVRHYFKETDYHTNCRAVRNPKYANCIYGATNIGVCCGRYCGRGNMIVWLTYIDQETLCRGEKKIIFDDSVSLTAKGVDAQGNRLFEGDLKAYIESCE